MASFQIESYTVRSGRNPSVPFARLQLSSPVLAHGIVNRAMLYYFPTYSSLGGSVTNVGGFNFDGIHIYAAVPFDDFDQHYHLLQTESPLTLVYNFGSADGTTKPLRFLAIDSDTEAPGEGLEDIDALAEGNLDDLIGG